MISPFLVLICCNLTQSSNPVPRMNHEALENAMILLDTTLDISISCFASRVPTAPDRRSAGGGAEKQLNFLEAGRTGAPQQQAADPAASLNLFVKRLRTLKSEGYEDWCLKTLGFEGGEEEGLVT